MKLPPRTDLIRLLKSLKRGIGDDYRASEEDTLPGMQVTIGASADGAWDYQTGDNSFTGGAYHHRHWAVISLYRTSNSAALADDILSQLADSITSAQEDKNVPKSERNHK